MPRLLIIDDAMTDRVRIAGIASKWMDCTIFQADSGKVAMELIATHLPDLILTDLHMPEMTGLELVAAVKREHPGIPVILMTAQGSEEIAAQALRDGAASYVPKLRLASDLVETLNQVYKTSQAVHSQSRLMHYMTDTVTSFVLPNEPGLINICVGHLLSMLRCLPLGDEAERLRVGIALQEAMTDEQRDALGGKVQQVCRVALCNDPANVGITAYRAAAACTFAAAAGAYELRLSEESDCCSTNATMNYRSRRGSLYSFFTH